MATDAVVTDVLSEGAAVVDDVLVDAVAVIAVRATFQKQFDLLHFYHYNNSTLK